MHIQWEDALASFKARLASGEDIFGPLIRKYLLDNKHRCAHLYSQHHVLGPSYTVTLGPS